MDLCPRSLQANDLGCVVLDFDTQRYITVATVDAVWREFGDALVATQSRARVLLVDSPASARRAIYRSLPEHALWLADSSATAANLHEEVEGRPLADTVSFFLRQNARNPGPTTVVVDGVHRLGLRRQADLLRRLATTPSVQTVLLGGDSAGRVYHRAVDGWTLCCHAARQMGLARELRPSVVQGGPGLAVCQAKGGHPAVRWSEAGGEPDTWRWVRSPVANPRLVAWVCRTITIPGGTMTVANSEPETRTLAASLRGGPALTGLMLCDGTVPHVDQEVRVILTVPRRARFGETLRVVSRTENDGVTLMPRVGPVVTLSASELRSCCRPARLGTLSEQGNSHYAQRPVMVLLNHGARARPTWDPLYTAIGLGASMNVTVVANKSTLEAAQERMRTVLDSAPPRVPPVWRSLAHALLTEGYKV